MKKILVSGGCGYIGGHTIVDLIDHGFEVISVDDLSRGSMRMHHGIERIVHKPVKNYKVNLCDLDDTRAIFTEHPDIAGIIHFAAYKSVPESVADPLRYYKNNLESLINILQCTTDFGIKNFVFSSSCSVYGNPDKLPVDENAPLKDAESPYAHTKQIGEEISRNAVRCYDFLNVMLLRYFNPVGAHPSGIIGELQEKPENLVPVITQTAIGKREGMHVFGTDYPTRDGSCIRDYIHVMDIANAHTKALQYMLEEKNQERCELFNLGSGNGVTVLELIRAFEKIAGQSLNYQIGPRRAGDVIAVYANNNKAKQKLGWEAKYTLEDMMETAWKWELELKKEAERIQLN